MAYLLDTNILSELRKATRCDPRVLQWARAASAERHCISVLSLGEIRKGIELLRPRAPDQSIVFEQWLEALSVAYADDIIPVTEEVSDQWGRLVAVRPMPTVDGLLAATALEFRLTLVTRNTSGFRGLPVALLNPFELNP